MEKYAELKALAAGTTSIVSLAAPGANRTCYGSLARTIDQKPNDLGADYIQTANLFPNTSGADGVCANFVDNSTHAYLISIAEGSDVTALKTFATLGTVTTTDNCLYAPQTAIVHGTALGDTQFTIMAANSMSLVWLPHSDVTLYDQSANVPLARSKGINVSLGTSWSITGSHNLLDELRFADQIDNTRWGDTLSAYDLVQMSDDECGEDTASAGRTRLDRRRQKGRPHSSLPARARIHGRRWSMRGRAIFASVLVGGVALHGDAWSCSQRRRPRRAARPWTSVAFPSSPAWPSLAERFRTSSDRLMPRSLRTSRTHLPPMMGWVCRNGRFRQSPRWPIATEPSRAFALSTSGTSVYRWRL